MDNLSGVAVKAEDQLYLPPGFRFHPTDEELISYYLFKKVLDTNFSSRAIGDVDLNKSEPWELPWKAKLGEKEWYFFCLRDRKYPTGLRTNRATDAGYWKATGKDKEIYRGKSLIGMKKTLVFYKGRAPKGTKTNWVMHEYRLEGKFGLHNLPKTAKNEWVICRVFQKTSGGKKIPISGLAKTDPFTNNLSPPPLLDPPPWIGKTEPSSDPPPCVPCFSSPATTQYPHHNSIDIPHFTNQNVAVPVQSTTTSRFSIPSPYWPGPQIPFPPGISFPGSVLLPEQSILKALIENKAEKLGRQLETKRGLATPSHGTCLSADMNTEISSFEDNQTDPVDLDCFWSFQS